MSGWWDWRRWWTKHVMPPAPAMEATLPEPMRLAPLPQPVSQSVARSTLVVTKGMKPVELLTYTVPPGRHFDLSLLSVSVLPPSLGAFVMELGEWRLQRDTDRLVEGDFVQQTSGAVVPALIPMPKPWPVEGGAVLRVIGTPLVEGKLRWRAALWGTVQ